MEVGNGLVILSFKEFENFQNNVFQKLESIEKRMVETILETKEEDQAFQDIPKILSKAKAAVIIGVQPNTINPLIKRGELKMRTDGKINKSDLLVHLTEYRHKRKDELMKHYNEYGFIPLRKRDFRTI